jgi:hypothetical protein
VSERENPAKKEEEALRRLSEPEGDHELHTALERMRLVTRTYGGYSTGCTSPTMPTPQSSRSGEGRLRAAGRTPCRLNMTSPCASCRCRFSSSLGKSGEHFHVSHMSPKRSWVVRPGLRNFLDAVNAKVRK